MKCKCGEKATVKGMCKKCYNKQYAKERYEMRKKNVIKRLAKEKLQRLENLYIKEVRPHYIDLEMKFLKSLIQ